MDLPPSPNILPSIYSKLLLKITKDIDISGLPFSHACEMVPMRNSNHVGKLEATAWWLSGCPSSHFSLGMLGKKGRQIPSLAEPLGTHE